MVSTISHLRFACWASFTLYLVLLLCEYLRPGFVSTNMNAHVVLLAAALFACADRSVIRRSRVLIHGVIAAVIGVVLALIVWHIGADFGVMRFWISLAVGVAPILFFSPL